MSDLSSDFEIKTAGRLSQRLTIKTTKTRVCNAFVDVCYVPRPVKGENYDSKVVKFSTRKKVREVREQAQSHSTKGAGNQGERPRLKDARLCPMGNS